MGLSRHEALFMSHGKCILWEKYTRILSFPPEFIHNFNSILQQTFRSLPIQSSLAYLSTLDNKQCENNGKTRYTLLNEQFLRNVFVIEQMKESQYQEIQNQSLVNAVTSSYACKSKLSNHH